MTYLIVLCHFIALEMMKHSYSSEIDQLLKYVEEKFSDVRLPDGVVTRLELIGKGVYSK